MDELEKKPDAPQVSAKKKPEQKNSFDNRKKLMYVLCGGYLLYLALKMGRDYPGLAASGVWSSDRIIALCGTIAFSIIGAALLIIVAVRSVREWKQDAQNEQGNIRMNDMTLFLDLILMASGAYCMYTFLRLAVTKRLFKNGLLVPKEKKISDCADEQMYIGYMMPPLAVMAVMTMGYGVCMLLNDLRETPFLPYPWPLVILAAVLGSLVWYAIRNSRANRDYFGM